MDESPPAPKKAKVAATQPAPKVIKPSTASAPRKTEHPCRYCDRVFSRGDRRDTHEKTHKDDRAFGELTVGLLTLLKPSLTKNISFQTAVIALKTLKVKNFFVRTQKSTQILNFHVHLLAATKSIRTEGR